jgi:hypothetical protein
VTTTKKPITPVSTDPMMTSSRSYRRSSTVSFLSTAYDWIKLSPRGESGANGGRDDQDRLGGQRHTRHDKAHSGLSPIRLGHETCGNVGHEHRRQGHQKVLDAMELAAQDQHRHADRDAWTARQREMPNSSNPAATPASSAHVVPRFASTSNWGCTAIARSIPVADQTHQALPGHHARPRSESHRRWLAAKPPAVLWAAAGCAIRTSARRVIGESNPRSAVVAGDDLGDLCAFAAAVELKAHDRDALCVAVDSAEAPRALIDEADVIVNGAPRLLELLQRLLACTM